jgi:hypothetical protein
MMTDAIGLGLVQPVLDVIAREGGCKVDCYMVLVEAGAVQIDVYDPDWQGALPARKVFKAIGVAVEALSKLQMIELRLIDMDKCPNEGGTLSVKLTALDGGFRMSMGWR